MFINKPFGCGWLSPALFHSFLSPFFVKMHPQISKGPKRYVVSPATLQPLPDGRQRTRRTQRKSQGRYDIQTWLGSTRLSGTVAGRLWDRGFGIEPRSAKRHWGKNSA